MCPHCRGEVEKRVAICRRCGFDYAACEQAFPYAAPPLSLVIDPAHLLPGGIEGDVQGPYEKLRKRFPQVDISFCFVRLQEGVATQEFAFWLHNAAPEADESRAWLLLVVGDLNSGRLALSVGYALEPFVNPAEWESALHELAASIGEAEWTSGLAGFLGDARNLLTTAWAGAEQRRKNSQRKREEKRQSSKGRKSVRPESAPPATESELPAPGIAGPPPEVSRPETAQPQNGPATMPPVPRADPRARENAATPR